MLEPSSAAPPTGFKDRRGGLIGFGILTVALGLFCALLAVLIFAIPAMPGPRPLPLNAFALISTVLVYGGLAGMFIWLGVGSILARRWARTLLLVLAWIWLLTGVVGLGAVAVVVNAMPLPPAPDGRPLPEDIRGVLMVMTFVVGGVLGIVLPAVLVLFYRSPHVAATCEARDPVVRWTDACPLPVLSLSLYVGLTALCGLPMALFHRGVAPFFGILVNDAPGMAFHVALTGAWVYIAWATYRLKIAGWWTLVLVLSAVVLSATLTFARVDLIDLYRLGGYPDAQIALMRPFSPSIGRAGVVVLLWLVWLPTLGYLMYVKKYFRR